MRTKERVEDEIGLSLLPPCSRILSVVIQRDAGGRSGRNSNNSNNNTQKRRCYVVQEIYWREGVGRKGWETKRQGDREADT